MVLPEIQPPVLKYLAQEKLKRLRPVFLNFMPGIFADRLYGLYAHPGDNYLMLNL